MKIITHQHIESLGITPRQCVEWIYESFSNKNQAQLPAKISVHPSDTDFFTSMPCLLPESDNLESPRYFGIKEVHRIAGATPSLGSDMMLYNARNGELLALADCDWVTTMRTGAVAAVTAKALRKDGADVYGFIGLGNTARATLLCILEAETQKHFKIKLLKYKNQADIFIERFQAYNNVTFDIVDTKEELAEKSDVLISCITSADGLLFEDEKIFKPGITIIPVHMRGFQNCDTVFDRVFGDDTDHVKNFKYFGQFKDFNEIGEVLAGRDKGRKSQLQRILAYNYGLALHDVIFVSKIYELVSDRHDIRDIETNKPTDKFWI